MATFKVPEAFTYAAEAGADLTAGLNLLAKLQADGTAVLAGDGDKAFGTIIENCLQSTVPYGPVSLQFGGIAKCVASAAIQAGNRVQAAASGKVKVGNANPIGMAIETVSAANQLLGVALIL